MPDIHFDCPKCKQSLDAPEELAAQLIECPTCKETIEVPVRNRPAKLPVSPPPQPPPVSPQPQPQPINPNLQVCPACKVQISREANTCPHCGHPIRELAIKKLLQ